MKYWIATPSAALGVASYLLYAAPVAADRADVVGCVKVAAAEASVMSDACTFSVVGQATQCTVSAHSDSGSKALNWPGDFIMMTVDAAVQAWTGTLALLAYLYDAVHAVGQAII